MIVLHAGVESGRLMLWAERSLEGKAPSAGRRKPSRKGTPAAAISPYDIGESGLAECLRQIGVEGALDREPAKVVVAWLPTVDGLPASSPLIAPPLDGAANVSLVPWKVTSIAVTTVAAVDLLCACMGQQTLAP